MLNKAILLDLIKATADDETGLRLVIKNLPMAAIAWRPDAEANSIGLTVWHISRTFDVFKVRLLEGKSPNEELWHLNGWRDKTGYDPRGTGWDGFGNLAGYTQDEVSQVPIMTAEDQLAYFDQVVTALINWVEATPEESLHQTSVGFPEEEMTAYGWLKFGILIDVREHIGEIKAIKAMWERRYG